MNKDMEIFSKLARLERLMHRERGRMRREGHPFADISRGQGRILAMLKIKDGTSTKDLSYLLGIRVSSLNETLAKMEKNGYISRKPLAEDKRISMIYMTEKGRSETLDQADPPTIFNCLSDEEKQIFGRCLDKLIAELESCGGLEDCRRNFRRNDERRMGAIRNHIGTERNFHGEE